MKTVHVHVHEGTVHEDQRTFCLRRHKFPIKPVLGNTQYFYMAVSWKSTSHKEWSVVYTAIMVTRTRHNVTLYVHCLSCSVFETSKPEYTHRNNCTHVFQTSRCKDANNSLCIFFLWRCGPTRAKSSSFTRFPDHTQWRATVGRTSLDEWLARRRDLYLTTTTLTTDRYQCPWWDSNTQSQRASGSRPTP